MTALDLSIRTNIMALNSHRNITMISTGQSRAARKLSSGFGINSVADDAAGLDISEKMRGQIRGLNQAARNSLDGVSLIQTAEGGIASVNEMIIEGGHHLPALGGLKRHGSLARKE